ncbi:WYL domain-containing protein [Nocardioides sp.]|uniref:helix-turn-helix transcriptional regulator n=1 Tax=Nocardioides sp. TaxID=35761 RepID=UPI00286A7F47|nr:WYL domain-containing protein [Nocardioides sp.]
MSTPPPGAKDQVARLLTLVPFLHTHGQVRIDDAAAALGVPADQLVTDLMVLLMCGLPGGYPDDLIDVDLDALDAGVIRVSNADYLARPLRLNPTEASAIIVALRALRDGAKDETREVVDRALAKLEVAAAEAGGTGHIDPGVDTGDADRAVLAVRLREAVTAQRQVRLTYYVPTRDEESERVVDPRAVTTHGGIAYLDAWCHSAEAPRLFRLDRIAGAEVLDTPVAEPTAAPRDLGEGLFTSSAETTPVTLRLHAPAHWVTEYYPVEAVRRRRGNLLEVDLQVADERWLTRLLLRLSPHAEVVAPAAYGTAFREAARGALNLYA